MSIFFFPGLAWWVIPASWAHVQLGPLTMQSWRIFVVLCSVPSLSSALLFGLMMPESPKFLMEVRHVCCHVEACCSGGGDGSNS